MSQNKDGRSASPSIPNHSTEKTMQIIELLSGASQPMRLLDIAQTLHLNKSTVSRFLSTLMALHYVEQEKDSSRYYLTFKICHIAARVQGNMTLSSFARPYLHRLAEDVNASVCLAIEESRQVVYIDVVNGPDQILKTMQRIGNIAPLHCTGIGKLLLLNYSYADLLQLYQEKGFARFTANTLTTVEELFSRLAQIREQGFALDDEECEIGVRCVALPIYDYTGRVIAGLSVTGSSGFITDDFIREKLPLISQTTNAISRRLGAAL